MEKKRSLATMVVIAGMLLLSTVLQAGTKITWNMEYEPKTFDSQKLTDVSSMEMAAVALEGLVRLGENAKVLPGVAQTWTVNGNKLTFKLRKDAKWSNGDAITAKDFVYGFKRGLEPDTASEYAYMMYDIKNAKQYNEKKITDFTQVGVKALDDYTFEIELNNPTPYFLSMIGTLPIFFPLNEKFYTTHAEKFASTPDNNIYNGPYMMKEWIHESKITFVKNPLYWNAKNIKIDELVYVMVKDYSTASNMYKNNEIDATYVSGLELPSFKGSKELKSFSDGSNFFLELNTKNKLLANVNIRKAISYAIDRKTLTEKVMRDGCIGATGFVPPGFPGAAKTFREESGKDLFKDNNIAEAKALFAKGLKEVGHTGKVKFNFLCDNRETTQKYAQVIQAQLNKNLGIEIVLEPVTFQIRLQRMTSKDFDIVWAGWGADFFDPMTFLSMYVSTSENLHTSWTNKKFDELIAEANKATDAKSRSEAMAKAERILADEMPVAPVYYRMRNLVVKPKINGVFTIPVAHNVDFYNASIKK